MTEERLKQYRAACGERDLWAKKLRQLESKRNHSTVLDSGGPGGTIREINIWQRGRNEQTYRKRYQKWLQKAEELLEEIDAFIEPIQDSQMRQIIELKFKDGLTWQRVADELGGNNTESGVKSRFHRYIKTCNTCNENLC